MRPLLFLALASVSLGGCVTPTRIEALALADQKLTYNDGRPTVISVKETSAVAFGPASSRLKSGQRGSFFVHVMNLTDDEFLFAPENVSARHDGSEDQEAELHVYTHDELVEEVRAREAWRSVAAALAGMGEAMSAASAGYSSTYGSYDTYSPYGYGSGTFAMQTYDYGVAQRAQHEAQERMASNFRQIQADSEAAVSGLDATILKLNTVRPWRIIGGVIKMDLPDATDEGEPILIEVRAGEDVHVFKQLYKTAAR